MEWISILKCPVTGESLHALEPDEVISLNLKASEGLLITADGKEWVERIVQAVGTADRSYVYPIVNDIVLLLKDLAVVSSEGNNIIHKIDKEKQLVQDFYNREGWIKDDTGNYQDAVLFEDLRDVSKDYIKKCHERVSRYLPTSGKYILDAASGALQYDEYLQYSEDFKYRICVDLSFKALIEAKKKLGDRGLCVLRDMTNLPFKDEVIEGFVSMNTIFHIPKDEQANAIKELYRVLVPGGKGVVVYDWFKHSTWMNIWLLPFRGFVFLKNRLLDGYGKMLSTKGVDRKLYFYAHSPAYFREHLPAHKVRVWRTLSVHFMRYYIHPWLFGKQILEYIYNKEESEPERCGLKGEYPILVFEKCVGESSAEAART